MILLTVDTNLAYPWVRIPKWAVQVRGSDNLIENGLTYNQHSKHTLWEHIQDKKSMKTLVLNYEMEFFF